MDQSATTRGAAAYPQPGAVLQLLKPVTWFPPMWAFACGAVSSGQPLGPNWILVAAGLLLSGPLVCGASQAVNDWYDRHVDAINEPGRPIPSGRIPGSWGLRIAVIWTLLSLAVAAGLGAAVFWAAVFGLIMAWAYSAPPARLKLNGWWGNSAVALCYEGLPWFTGAAALLGGVPPWPIVVLALLYSLGAHGIMTLNDFKAIEGDQRMGVRSLPVQLGVDGAARVACAVMALPQAVVAVLLFSWDRPYHAAAVLALLLAQLVMMARFLRDPKGRALWYSGLGVTLYVSGMMVSAFAARGVVW
jgi:chlorophyll synthase